MPAFPKPGPPRTARTLEQWVLAKARADGVAVDRARRSLSFMVVAAVLSQLIDEERVPLFVLKGGVAMELRFGSRARASRDYDAAFRQDLASLQDVLDEARRHPIGEFVVAAGRPEPIGPTGALRIMLRIRYGTRPWGTVALEVSPAEGDSGNPVGIDYVPPAPDLSVFGLETQGDVPCLPVRYQVAQKLHACTEILEHKENDRFRDLIDLLLLEELIGGRNWSQVRAACEEVFSLRGKQAWPPVVTVFPGWREAFARVASETAFPITDVNVAAGRVADLVRRIAQA
jgi:hypothetical protein